VRLSICKRADEGDALLVRLTGPPNAAAHARLRFFRPLRRAWLSDLDERDGPALAVAGDELAVPIVANEVVTVGVLF
jgi:hypothetical protein